MNPVIFKHFGPYSEGLFLNLWRLFIDADRQEMVGPMGFDINEPGYLESLVSALDYMLETLDEPLSFSLLAKLHKKCVEKAYTKSTYQDEAQQQHCFPIPFSTGVRRTCSGDFGLTDNVTLNGLYEIYQLIATGQLPNVRIEIGSPESESSEEPLRLTGEGASWLTQLQQVLEASRRNECNLHISSNVLNIPGRVSNIIQRYQRDILGQHELRNKLLVIAKCVRDLEVTHPFYDGNCRLLATIVLNKLLLQNNLSPTILGNPNWIDAYSVEELSHEIAIGQKRFQAVAQRPVWRTSHGTPKDYPIYPNYMYFYKNVILSQLFILTAAKQVPLWEHLSLVDRTRFIEKLTLRLSAYQGGLAAVTLCSLQHKIADILQHSIEKNFSLMNFICTPQALYRINFSKLIGSYSFDKLLCGLTYSL